jgi:hypothetical protein
MFQSSTVLDENRLVLWTSEGMYTVEVSGGLETFSPTLPAFSDEHFLGKFRFTEPGYKRWAKSLQQVKHYYTVVPQTERSMRDLIVSGEYARFLFNDLKQSRNQTSVQSLANCASRVETIQVYRA